MGHVNMLVPLVALLCVCAVRGATVAVKFELRNWVVDYQRPTNSPRVAPYDLAWADKLDAYLANNSFPGPAVEANVGDTVEVTVVNELIEAQIKLLFDGAGISMSAQPSGPIRNQGGEGKYSFVVGSAGTFWWRASLPSQAQRGLMGPIVVRDPKDAALSEYSEERMVVLSNAQARPDTCLDASVAGCPAGKVALNGEWGDRSKGWPGPVIEVVKDKCYRLRFLGMPSASGSQYVVKMSQHTLKILGRSGSAVDNFQLQASENIDAVLCADQGGVFFNDYDIVIDYLDKFGKPLTSLTATLRYVKPEEEVQEVRALKNGVVGQEMAFDRSQCDVDLTFDLRDQIVDYLRPTKNARKDIPAANRKAALLVNKSYPGPPIEAMEDDLICVTVLNNMDEEPAAIHWHGQHMRGFPATATPPNVIALAMSNGLIRPLRVRDFITNGVPLTILAATFGAIITYYMGQAIFDSTAPLPEAICSESYCKWVYAPGWVQDHYVGSQACIILPTDGLLCQLWNGTQLSSAPDALAPLPVPIPSP